PREIGTLDVDVGLPALLLPGRQREDSDRRHPGRRDPTLDRGAPRDAGSHPLQGLHRESLTDLALVTVERNGAEAALHDSLSLSCVCVSRWAWSDQGRVDGREDDEHPEREAGERSEDLDCVFHDLTFPFSNV